MATWAKIIQHSLLEIGVIAGGESPEQHKLDSGMERLRWMLDEWSIDGLLVPGIIKTEVTVKTGDDFLYTIGPAAENPDVVVADTPYRISRIRYRDYDSGCWTTLLQLSQNRWIDSAPDEWAVYVKGFGYEPGKKVGTIRFNKWPEQNDQFSIWHEGYLTDGDIELSMDTGLPRGYQRPIVLALAIELAPSHGVTNQISAATLAGARKSKSVLRKLNVGKLGQARYDAGVLQSANTRGSWRYGNTLPIA